jgi:hypothetical protein
VLHLPEFVPEIDVKEVWDLTTFQSIGGGGESHNQQLQFLRRLSGIDVEEKLPSIISMAKLVFLYLMVNIYKEKVKLVNVFTFCPLQY